MGAGIEMSSAGISAGKVTLDSAAAMTTRIRDVFFKR